MAASLADVWLPGLSSKGLLTGLDSTTIAGGSKKNVPGGIGFNTTSNARRYSTSILNNQHAAWLIIGYRDGSGNVEQSVVRKDGTITPLQDWDGDVRIATFNTSGYFQGTVSYGNSSAFANRINTVCGYLGADKGSIWANNGPEIAVGTGSQVGGPTGNPFCIGGNENGGEIASAWTVTAVFLWQGPNIPSVASLRAFSNNPWQLFDAGSGSSAYQSAIASTGGTSASSGTATITGVSSFGSTGSMAASASASASAIGVSSSSLVGNISGSGSSTATTAGIAASAISGAITAVANGIGQVSGVNASASTGTVSATASGNASANISGVAAAAQSGTIAYAATGSASVAGVSSSALSGAVSANASGNASVNVTGIAASSSAGAISASASANGGVVGAAAFASTGAISAVANGNSTATILGVAASPVAGSIGTSGSARASVGALVDQGGVATASGVSAFAMAGVILASVPARANITGFGATATTGTMTATGVIDGNVSAYLTGLVAATTVGMIAATGTRTKITVDITEDMLCKVVRDYIKSIAPSLRVLRTPVNKASMPDGAYVSFTPGTRSPLSTNVGSYLNDSRSVMRAEQMRFQIDCYGEGARDLAEVLNTLFRDQYACDQFAASGLNIAPLHAGDIMQMPFVNDADQYEERYTFEIFLQVNSIIITAQQSCNMLGINILPVETTYPIV